MEDVGLAEVASVGKEDLSFPLAALMMSYISYKVKCS